MSEPIFYWELEWRYRDWGQEENPWLPVAGPKIFNKEHAVTGAISRSSADVEYRAVKVTITREPEGAQPCGFLMEYRGVRAQCELIKGHGGVCWVTVK